jgi:hypothetical protein
MDYRLNPAIAQSDLKMFMQSPELYKYYKVDGGEGKPETDSTRFGTLMHTLILEPETFKERYYIKKADTPTSAQQKAFAAEMAFGEDVRYEEVYKKHYKTEGKSDATVEKAASKLATDLRPYIRDLYEGKGKIFIKEADREKALTMGKALAAHPLASKIMFKKYKKEEGIEVFVELEIFSTVVIDGVEYEVKCKVDRLVVDTKKKAALVTDYKTTTSKNASEMRSSIFKFGYDIQVVYYNRLVKDFLKEKGYDITAVKHALVCQYTEPPYHVMPVEIGSNMLEAAGIKIDKAFAELHNCMTTGVWTEGMVKVDLHEG